MVENQFRVGSGTCRSVQKRALVLAIWILMPQDETKRCKLDFRSSEKILQFMDQNNPPTEITCTNAVSPLGLYLTFVTCRLSKETFNLTSLRSV